MFSLIITHSSLPDFILCRIDRIRMRMTFLTLRILYLVGLSPDMAEVAQMLNWKPKM